MPKILMKEKKNMNIKRAKQEIKDSIEAYLTKDNYGEYKIPSIRQRPILLMGPPGIGKTQIMEQIARECEIGLVAIRSRTTQDRVRSVCHLSEKKNIVDKHILLQNIR